MTTIPKFLIWLVNGPVETESDYTKMTDETLRRMGIMSIERWSQTIEDYVEIRRIP